MFGISIVIPCKNEEKYISRCIDSLLRQEGTILDKEVIVVDNGSTDNTLRILENYGSEISYYVHPDLPIAGLRNFGVEKSTKEWIAFVDADVEVDRYWAKMLSQFLEDQVKKGVDAFGPLMAEANRVTRANGRLMIRDFMEPENPDTGVPPWSSAMCRPIWSCCRP